MTEDPIAISMSAKVREAVAMLQTLDIRHLPVVDENQELVGMLSDRDLRSFEVPQIVAGEWIESVQTALDANVSSLMSGGVLSVTPDADSAEIVELMLDHKIGAVPVIDAEGKLAGIVSYVDILREIAEVDEG